MARARAKAANNSSQNEEDDREKPRLLLFSDSVQDAAQRAAVAEIRNTATVVRKSLYRTVEGSPAAGLSLREVIEDLPQLSLQDHDAILGSHGPELPLRGLQLVFEQVDA